MVESSFDEMRQELVEMLREVIEEEDIEEYLKTPSEFFGGRSPDAILRGDGENALAYFKAHLEGLKGGIYL